MKLPCTHRGCIILAVILVISVIFNVVSFSRNISPNIDNKDVHLYPLLSDQVEQEHANSDLIVNVTDLRSSLFQQTASYSANVGVYFDYLPTNSTIGIHERSLFTLASLLMVPIVMTIYEKIDNKQLSLNDRIELTQNMRDDSYGTLWQKPIGTAFSVQDAIQYSLVDSDNTANQILLSKVTPEEVGKVFTAFDIQTAAEEELSVSPKNYSSVLRSLYYSTYLDPQDSQDILQILTKASFIDGTTYPLHPGYPIAHKIGVHDKEKTYSDCSINYFPKHHYILCIMVKDLSKEESTTIISNIITTVYTFMKQYQN